MINYNSNISKTNEYNYLLISNYECAFNNIIPKSIDNRNFNQNIYIFVFIIIFIYKYRI